MQPKLGILAGGGQLPHQIIQACKKNARNFFVIVFEGQNSPDEFKDVPIECLRLGAAGSIIKRLKKENCNELVFAGSIKKPNLKQLRPDFWTTKFLARSGGLRIGDDGILSSLVRDLEVREGFTVIGVDKLLPNLIATLGIYGIHSPTKEDYADIQIAKKRALELGREDKGQACISRYGQVIGVEGPSGTDDLLKNLKRAKAPAGVLVKMKKPNQEYRTDLPTIGQKTVQNVFNAGLRGIAIEAGSSLIIDRQDVINTANKLNIFVLGIPFNE